MRFLIGMAFTMVTASALLLFGWNRDPVLSFREEREVRTCQSHMQRYLDHRESLDEAAHGVAVTILRYESLSAHHFRDAWFDEPVMYDGFPSACFPDFGPSGDEVILNAFKLSAPTPRLSRLWDSVITTRGYRSIQ